MKKLLTILLSVLSLATYSQQKVAVYVTGEQSGVSKVLGDQLVAAFAKSGKYTAIERTTSFLAELNKEYGYQRSGAVSDNDIARLGIQFGVQYVCVADISDVFGEKYISARLINVETAEIVNAHNVSGEMNSMGSCLSMAGEIAENLSKGSFADQAKEAKLKEEANRKKAQEDARKQKLLSQGLVDLGLPSGTLWKNKNETGLYNFKDATYKFGEGLPTKRDWEELRDACQWRWDGDQYIVTGPNGEFITLPREAYRGPSGTLYNDLWGYYWSSSPDGSLEAWGFGINPHTKNPFVVNIAHQFSIRCVSH